MLCDALAGDVEGRAVRRSHAHVRQAEEDGAGSNDPPRMLAATADPLAARSTRASMPYFLKMPPDIAYRYGVASSSIDAAARMTSGASAACTAPALPAAKSAPNVERTFAACCSSEAERSGAGALQ